MEFSETVMMETSGIRRDSGVIIGLLLPLPAALGLACRFAELACDNPTPLARVFEAGNPKF
jgi:hypothetical protein